jgi:hypothetical protein
VWLGRTHVQTCVRTHIHTCIHTVHTYIRTYVLFILFRFMVPCIVLQYLQVTNYMSLSVSFFTLFLQLYMFRAFRVARQGLVCCLGSCWLVQFLLRQCHVRTYYFGLITGLHTTQAHIHLSSQQLTKQQTSS